MDIGQLILNRDANSIVTCDARMTMRDAIAILADKRIGALPVMEDRRVVGIFSERDVIYCMAKEGGGCLDRPVGEVMTSPAITVERSEKIDEALSLMTRRRIRHLPVVEEGSLLGFVSIGDLVKSRFEKVQQEAQEMRSYIQTA
ncbi:CBS domain-containing protein [Citromicrobium bathyomarinum]|jgi:CBS domain-containing protein|uniref:CBS domain-containing protein n=1 Tax=Sphingomonadales TaxID=204457 RepID=UPI000225E289|nr:CBS domain-containing protein [Citromicrobium sp. JLT1363]MBL4791606.1 CBS domain-containing protein [Citromicrobium sp.]MBO80811.1 CBS domain-containing protein [Citromicrobium sp.]|tara:strand:+ start:670 stop:1101 length:432 start_codon:yes stop_codon:yes gene_type:complete